MALWLAAHKPRVEMIQMLHIQRPTQIVIDAYADGNKKGNPHLGCTVRDVGKRGGSNCYTDIHELSEGIFPIQRDAAVNGFLTAFGIPCLIAHVAHILQTATLEKVGNGLTSAFSNLLFEIEIRTWKPGGENMRTLPSRVVVERLSSVVIIVNEQNILSAEICCTSSSSTYTL